MSALEVYEGRAELVKRQLFPSCKAVTDDELTMYLTWCQRYQLDPLAGQTYAMRSGRFTFSATIQGLRALAERTGVYLGQTGPFWCGADAVWVDVWLDPERRPPFACKVEVWRDGWPHPVTGVAKWATWHKKIPTWDAMPDHMLAIRAEALALKRAFPAVCALEVGDESDAFGARRRHVFAALNSHGVRDPEARHELVRAATGGETESTKALTAEQTLKIIDYMEEHG